MARQATIGRPLHHGLALLVGAMLTMLLVAGSARAAAEPPVWKILSIPNPTHLVPNSPRNTVEMLHVDASEGNYGMSVDTGQCGPVPKESFSATENAAAMQAQLETICGVPPNGIKVTGGPGAAGGGTYTFEFQEGLGSRPIPLFAVVPPIELSGGAKTAQFSYQTTGSFEPVFIVSATNVGGTTDGGPVTIEDHLPPGVIPTKVYGHDAYASPFAAGEGAAAPLSCAPLPAIRCTWNDAAVTGDTLIMEIKTKVGATPSGTIEDNQASVSGGGALKAASISAPFEVSNTPASFGPAPGSVIAATSTNQAGAHPSVTTAFTISTSEFGHTSEDEKDIRFDFPPGLVGNTVGLPKCEMSKILEELSVGIGTCPRSSMVGMAVVYLTREGEAPLSFNTPVFAIQPVPGEPVAFAFDALLFPVRLDTSVLSGGPQKEEQTYGVRITAPSLPEEIETLSNWITVWGVPADHNGPGTYGETTEYGGSFGGSEGSEVRVPLLSNPQLCGEPMQATMSADSWKKQGAFAYEEATMAPLVGCDLLNLESSFTMLPDTLEAGAPAGYNFDLNVPQNEDPSGLEPPTVKTVKLALPVGTVVSPGVAWGLKVCSDEQFGLHTGELANCPREAQVGTVEIETPSLLEKLKGDVYLATPRCSHAAEGQEVCTPENAENGEMVRLFVQAVTVGESKIIVKLEGKASINQQTGQITTTFENSPPLPFSDFKLTLGGGPRAALANPRQCGSATTTMDLTPWSTPFVPDVAPFYTFAINQACFGQQFNPSFVSGTTSIQSGEYSPFTLTFGRSDQDGFLAGLQTILPPGLLGKINGVTLCGEPQASEGACPENSLIGHVQALTGPGADPYLVTGGSVFLTKGYKGAPFGLSIVVPAVAGPYTLSGTTGRGTVVVRAAINVDKNDAHLTITADPLPTKLDGVPLQIKVVNVTVDRNEFTFNPTSCEKQSIQTTLTSLEGAVAHVSTPFQVTNCVGLGFNPRFEVSTQGKTSRTDGASLDAKLIYPLGKKLANVKNVRVELPKQLPSRLTTLQKACPDHVFEENPESCPPASRIGQARAKTPVLPNELDGWAYFVSHGGAAFPNLVVVLQDGTDGVRVDLVGETFISKVGITSTTFGTVPDVPISEFELFLPEGPNSALAANGNLCQSKMSMPTIFNGQNGGVLRQRTPISVTECATAASKSPHRARKAHATATHHKAKHKRMHKKATRARRAAPHAAHRRGK